MDKVKSRWEKDFLTSFTEGWVRLRRFNLAFSGNVCIQKNILKLIQRWYLTPSRMAQMFSQGLGFCWRCQNPHADYMHNWWSCARIYTFWSIVNSKIEEITRMKLPLNARVMLCLDFEYGGVIYICKSPDTLTD